MTRTSVSINAAPIPAALINNAEAGADVESNRRFL